MTSSENKPKSLPSPFQCFTSSLVAGGMSAGMYMLTSNIATHFAAKPIDEQTSTLAIRVAVTVRTLLVGITALGMAVFGIIGVSLFALGIQVLLNQKPTQE
jgi:hypothetical protein